MTPTVEPSLNHVRSSWQSSCEMMAQFLERKISELPLRKLFDQNETLNKGHELFSTRKEKTDGNRPFNPSRPFHFYVVLSCSDARWPF